MTARTYVRSTLIASLVVLALGGLMLHVRIHPVAKNFSNIVPVIAGILSVIVVPLLFSFKRTLAYGYVLNGFLAIIGTIVMAHFTLAHWPDPATPGAILFGTTLADIFILWTVFFVGKALFDLETFGYAPDRQRKGIPYRYPNLGWWLVHLAAVSLVYTVGNLVWR